MKVHMLKIWPHFLEDIIVGRRTFEIRSIKDRNFQAGDQLQLAAWDPIRGEYVMAQPPLSVDVIAVYPNLPGIEPGYVALSIRLPERRQ